MQTVLQYELTLGSGTQVLQVPTGSTLLRAKSRIESEKVLLWFVCPDDGAATEERTFKTFKPGEAISDNLANLEYTGSYTNLSGESSWVIFELI